MRRLFAVLAVFVFVTSLVLANYLQQKPTLSFAVPSVDEARKLDWVTIGLQAVFLLIGMLFGYTHKRLTDLKAQGSESVDIKAEARAVLSSTTVWLAISAAPLVFGIVVVLTGDIPIWTALFIAFQNGFFWERVMPQKPPEPQH